MKRPLFWAAVVFSAGIALGYVIHSAVTPAFFVQLKEQSLLIMLLPAGAVAAAGCVLEKVCACMDVNGSVYLRRLLFSVVTLIFLSSTGVVLSISALCGKDKMEQFMSSVDPKKDDCCVVGRVDELSCDEDSLRIVVDAFDIPGKVLVYSGKNASSAHDVLADLNINDTVRVTGRFAKYSHSVNPGQFDSADYYFARGIISGFYPKEAEVICRAGPCLKGILRRAVLYAKGVFEQVLPRDEAGLLLAMTTGEKDLLSDESRDMYVRNGLMHIMAISGLHISLMGLGVYRFLRRLGMYRFVSAAFALPAALVYVMLTGLRMSALRALVMFVLFLTAELKGRSYDSLTALSLAEIIILFTNPLLLSDSGFLLSIGAAAGLAVAENLNVKRVFSGLTVYLFIAPILLFSFSELPTYSVILNVLTAPLMPVILVCVLILLSAAAFAPGIASLLAGIPHFALKLYELLCSLSEKLPFHTIVLGRPKWYVVVGYYLFLLVVFLSVSRKKGWVNPCTAVCGVCFLLIGIAGFSHVERSATFLYVGQGDGIVIESKESCFLVDVGSSSEKRLTEYVLAPAMKSLGRGVIDGWFLSHADKDHISAANEVLEKMKEAGYKKSREESFGLSDYRGILLVNRIFLPCADKGFEEIEEACEELGIEVTRLPAGSKVSSGELSFICEWPVCVPGTESENDTSMVLSVCVSDEPVLLLTGDVTASVENQISARLKAKYADKGMTYEYLKAAHHGSKYSTSCEFLKSVFSRRSGGASFLTANEGSLDCTLPAAIISAGIGNRYGHPHEDTLGRLSQEGFSVLRTDRLGAVKVVF